MLKSSKLKRNKFNYNIVYSVQVKRYLAHFAN